MFLKYLKQSWDYINNIPSTLKTIIIILLMYIIGNYILDSKLQTFKNSYTELVQQNNNDSEVYTIEMSEDINRALSEILHKDGDAQSVILLQYHNSKKTLQGFSYLYLDYLTDCRTDPSETSAKKIFNDLEYVYYSGELRAIQESASIRVDSMAQFEKKFPRLYYDAFRFLNTSALAIYPLRGVDDYLGMLIVTYDKPKKYYVGYTDKIITPYVEQLTSILDYKNIKNRLKE